MRRNEIRQAKIVKNGKTEMKSPFLFLLNTRVSPGIPADVSGGAAEPTWARHIHVTDDNLSNSTLNFL
ncbi:hypothetical protein DRF67_15065 [Chryseobacterium pennipullorum]|uniref:Uncharacterized protein n=1 Tax=Chryseobacterium pennipullorum TaxID=2258963 RepID=A0A3D9AZC8_9FLAO|nr:hypothetical protein DRF67_15065 [Chryseobacterium pennipullorum]